MKQAQVIYYLSREGTLEHPHLIDVGYLEQDGLLLKDVKRRLVSIRGKGMPDLFSWSYKTKYRSDFIWRDVSDNDAILPMNDTEYILKGSQIVEGETNNAQLHRCPNDCESEIHCKNMLKEHCCLIKSPFHHRSEPLAGEECVIRTTNHPVEEKPGASKLYKPPRTSSSSEQEEDTGGLLLQKPGPCSPFAAQSRGEKPLPCINNKKAPELPTSRTDKTPPRKSVAALFGEGKESGERKKPGGSSSSSLIFRQMLPCADIGTKTQVHNGLFHGQKQVFSARENGAGAGFSSWRQSSAKSGRKGAKVVSLSADTGTKLSDSLAFVRGPNSTPNNNKFQDYSTLTRFKPRHSYSSRGGPPGEKVKEVDNEMVWAARPSNASRVSVESLYEVDCKARSALENGRVEESPRRSVGGHIISKLLMDATSTKAGVNEDSLNNNNNNNNNNKDKPVWWEEVRTPRRENENHERFRKSKLDWEKNLQEAVDMIIRPQQLH